MRLSGAARSAARPALGRRTPTAKAQTPRRRLTASREATVEWAASGPDYEARKSTKALHGSISWIDPRVFPHHWLRKTPFAIMFSAVCCPYATLRLPQPKGLQP